MNQMNFNKKEYNLNYFYVLNKENYLLLETLEEDLLYTYKTGNFGEYELLLKKYLNFCKENKLEINKYNKIPVVIREWFWNQESSTDLELFFINNKNFLFIKNSINSNIKKSLFDSINLKNKDLILRDDKKSFVALAEDKYENILFYDPENIDFKVSKKDNIKDKIFKIKLTRKLI